LPLGADHVAHMASLFQELKLCPRKTPLHPTQI
jgi:hypothetical protein